MPKLIYRPDFRDKARLAKKQRPVARKNKDGSDPSTHLYEYGQVGNKFVAYPTLFPKSAKSTSNPKDWIELDSDKAYNEARRRGEVVEFNDEHSAKGFAAGAWKDVDENPSTGSVMNSPLKKNENKNKGKGVDVLKNTFFKEGGKMPLKKKYQSGGKLQSEELGSNLKGGTFYTAKNGRVGRLTPYTGLRKDSGLNSSIDTTGYSKGKKSFDYMESTIAGTKKTAVTRERVLPIIENLKKGALRTEKFKEGGKMPLKKASGKGKGKRVKPV